MTSKNTFKVTKTQLLTHDIMLLEIKSSLPFQYQAGDYLMLGFNEGEKKPYSIASSPRGDGLIELHIRNQADTPFMAELFKVEVGQQLQIDGPNKQYQLDKNLTTYPNDIILIGGGTGFAPMKSLLDELLAQKFSNKIYFYWGATKPEFFYMHEQMLALEKKHQNLVYNEVLNGDVHQQVIADFESLATSRIYLCGPWDMVSSAKKDFLKVGLLEKNYN
jgi:CDP-4-dehydro-6-deoxyglucose reductase